jgi:hypothetical protein
MLTIGVGPEGELAKALNEADDETIILVSNGMPFVVRRAENNLGLDYDPVAFREALCAVVGTLTPKESE